MLALLVSGIATYTNPILYSDYSDPDVVCVDGEFWMTASSFNCVPGLQILHSYDLIHWEIIGAALPRLVFEEPSEFDFPAHGKGVWAPSIRYHGGLFYIFWGDPDRGIFQVHAQDPRGQWSEPVLVIPGMGMIDPCPLWDDDGRVYLVHGWAGSRAGFKSVLTMCELDQFCTRAISGETVVFDGNKTGNKTVEGPKIYKRNGLYYIFAPAGGVKTGWQLVLRSENIYGPYEHRRVMHQGKGVIHGPHQGGLVEDAKGDSWFIHFEDRYAWGRVTHLQPVHWDNEGWCIIGEDIDKDGVGEPVLSYRIPEAYTWDKTIKGISATESGTGFSGLSIPLNWQWQANPQRDWAFFNPSDGCLRLNCICPPKKDENLWHTPNMLLEKITGPKMTFEAGMNFRPGYYGDRVGLVVMGLDYTTLELDFDSDGVSVVRRTCINADTGNSETIDARQPFKTDQIFRNIARDIGESLHTAFIAKGRRDMPGRENLVDESLPDVFFHVDFKVEIDTEGRCSFRYSLDGKRFRKIGSDFYARQGRWIGAKIGFFAVSDIRRNDGGYVEIY